jgi:phosphinothricin acetyltransferase
LAEWGDLPGIRAIYNYAIRELPATFDTVEKTAEEREAWLHAHQGRFPVYVAVDDDSLVAGWAALSPYRERAAFLYTVESSVYLHPAYCGQGIGTLLMEALMRAARAQGHHLVIAQIVGDNAASRALHRKFGFTEVGMLREVGWKFQRWHDLLLMQAHV